MSETLKPIDWDDARTINTIAGIISHNDVYNWKAKHRMLDCLINLEKVLNIEC